MRQGGKVILVEWKVGESKFGPPKELQTSPEEMTTIFSNEGFVFEREFKAGQFHYGLVFKK